MSAVGEAEPDSPREREAPTRGLRGALQDATRLVSTLSHEVDWPWSGSVRNHVYTDFVVYMMLLIVFCCITLLPTTKRSSDSFNLVQSIHSTLVKEFRPEPEIAFDKIQELSGLRRWIEGPFMAVFYGYNPNTPPDDPAFRDYQPLSNYIAGFYLASTTVLGPIRLRQLRVKANSCEIEDKWKVLATSCHAPYTRRSAHITTNSTFNQMWANYTSIENVDERMETALRLSSLIGGNNQPPDEMIRAKKVALKGFQFNESTAAGVYRGRLANFYWEPGFVVDLPENNEPAARTVLALLGATNWLDTQTRALFLEFSLYLAPSDLMLSARLVAEVHETGTIWTDISLEPINMDIYRTSNTPQMALYVIGFIVVLIAVGWDMRSTWDWRHYQDRRTGAAIVWVVVGVMLYAAIITASILHVYNMSQAENLNFQIGEYLPTHKLGYGVTVERGLWAMASFVVWFRLLKFTSQLPVLGILGRTIGRAVPQVFVFFLISFVIFLAFAQCFFMAYYASVEGYQSYQASIMSVLRFTVLDFDYAALSRENRLLTPFLFSLLLLIVFFIWVNVMVAIISEVYQQENDRSLNVVQVDDDFQSMEPDVDQPQNDLKGMRYHSPVLADENEGHPAMIRLTPDKFFRVRISDLERFNGLVTIDMRAHFAALAEQARVKRQQAQMLENPGKGAPPTGYPRDYAVMESTSGQQPNSDSLGIDVCRDTDDSTHDVHGHRVSSTGAGAPAQRPQGVAEGRVKQSKMADSMSELEQHQGIYARLGCLGPAKQAARAARALNYDDDSDEDHAPDPPARKVRFASTKSQPMELQALYFDKVYHNPTSARMWWDKHKAFFDTREQLMQHLITSSQNALTKLGKKLRRTGTKARQMGAAGGVNPNSGPQNGSHMNPLSAEPARPGLRQR